MTVAVRRVAMRRMTWRVGGAALLALALATAPLTATPATAAGPVQCPTPTPGASASTSDGVGITALVCGPTASPTVGSTGGGTSPGGVRPVTGGVGVTGTGTSTSLGGSPGGGSPSSVAPSAPAPATLVDSVDLGGILSIGGLSTGSAPSINPFSGEVQMWFTVRNMSRSSMDMTVDFWMENAFGLRLSNIDGVPVQGLKPGETRTISADLPGAGQWTILTTHARVNPPAQVDGTELTSLTRDATVFVLPWFLVLMVGVGAAAAVTVSLVRRATALAVPAAVGA